MTDQERILMVLRIRRQQLGEPMTAIALAKLIGRPLEAVYGALVGLYDSKRAIIVRDRESQASYWTEGVNA